MRHKLISPIPLKEILTEVLNHRGSGQRKPLEMIREKWSEWVGSALGKKSIPMKIHGKRLIIGTLGSVWSQELELSKREILEKIRKTQPDLSLEEVRFRAFPHLPGFI